MSTSFFKLFEKYAPVIDYIVKPLLMAFIGLALSYHTLWLSANYVKQTDYNAQIDVINQKLDVIIQNQVAYKEQLATVNLLISNDEKKFDSQDERIRWLERDAATRGVSKP